MPIVYLCVCISLSPSLFACHLYCVFICWWARTVKRIYVCVCICTCSIYLHPMNLIEFKIILNDQTECAQHTFFAFLFVFLILATVCSSYCSVRLSRTVGVHFLNIQLLYFRLNHSRCTMFVLFFWFFHLSALSFSVLQSARTFSVHKRWNWWERRWSKPECTQACAPKLIHMQQATINI